MPARRLQALPAALSRFDAVGEDGAKKNFVRHVGLSSGIVPNVHDGDEIAVDHMGPPLRTARGMTANVIGTAELSYEEIKQIGIYIRTHLNEHQAHKLRGASGYVVVPHVKPYKDSSGVTVFVRFSCAGFAIEAYRYAGIDILDTSCLPELDRLTIAEAYPEVLKADWMERNREYDLGLSEEGPSPVVLPGYVFHALRDL
ncbi:MAG: hypothetical protein L0177_12170 [Chloroflexi bacterium]|nr:hypothetical protein [Chloroflexota bacterium]